MFCGKLRTETENRCQVCAGSWLFEWIFIKERHLQHCAIVSPIHLCSCSINKRQKFTFSEIFCKLIACCVLDLLNTEHRLVANCSIMIRFSLLNLEACPQFQHWTPIQLLILENFFIEQKFAYSNFLMNLLYSNDWPVSDKLGRYSYTCSSNFTCFRMEKIFGKCFSSSDDWSNCFFEIFNKMMFLPA